MLSAQYLPLRSPSISAEKHTVCRTLCAQSNLYTAGHYVTYDIVVSWQKHDGCTSKPTAHCI